MLSNGGDIAIAAANVFHNEALATGSAHFSRSCMIFCRSAASSTVSTTGGTISAAGNLSIRAGALAENIGGQVLAVGSMTVTAPKVRAVGITGYTRAGARAWLQGILRRYVGTSVFGRRGR
ncbi:hypothetical protein LGV81_20105 (plasmid) [Ralstonia pseudosolanacearum]|nr:hypothetical protein LGV81_20105 [Ralstonia sp. RS647]